MKDQSNNSLKVACLQMNSNENFEDNFSQIKHLVKDIQPGAVDLVCCPENSLYIRVDSNKPMKFLNQDSPSMVDLSELAAQLQCDFLLGSVPWEEDGSQFNATILVTESGHIKRVYNKAHLFDVSVEGVPVLSESSDFEAGQQPVILDYKGWKLGLSVCYDLRFANLFYSYAQAEVDLLLVPAAFLRKTGKAHWETLLRARAIECQAYLVAAAQAGCHKEPGGSQRWSHGHSLVIDPWGQVIEEGPAEEPWLVDVKLTKKEIAKVRRQIPMADHRKSLSKPYIIKP